MKLYSRNISLNFLIVMVIPFTIAFVRCHEFGGCGFLELFGNINIYSGGFISIALSFILQDPLYRELINTLLGFILLMVVNYSLVVLYCHFLRGKKAYFFSFIFGALLGIFGTLYFYQLMSIL